LPITTKKIFIDAIKSHGADIVVAGNVWDEAHQVALKFAKKINGAYISPFDDPLIWSGHATLIDEVANEGIKPDAVIAAVGGGGLACGILEGMQRHGWYDSPFYGVETEGSASFATALKENKLISLPEINTIASSLGAKQICKKLFDWRKNHPLHALTVTDCQAIRACYTFLDDHRVLLEPSSAAVVSVLYELNDLFCEYDSLLIIVCGGIGISLNLLNNFRKEVCI